LFEFSPVQDPKDSLRHFDSFIRAEEWSISSQTVQSVKTLLMQLQLAQKLYPYEFQHQFPSLNQGQFCISADYRRGRIVELVSWLQQQPSSGFAADDTWKQAQCILWMPEAQELLLQACGNPEELAYFKGLFQSYSDQNLTIRLTHALPVHHQTLVAYESHEAYFQVAKDMVNHDHPEARGANPMDFNQNCAILPDWKHKIVNKHQHIRKQSQEQEQQHKQRITTTSHGIKPSPASKLINY
jgi:hypothetical protein